MNRHYETIGAYLRLSGAWVRHEVPRKLRNPAFLGITYGVIGFLTFGHVAAANYGADKYEYEQCDHKRQSSEIGGLCWQPNPATAAIAGVGAGIFWPLYLSWELQQ